MMKNPGGSQTNVDDEESRRARTVAEDELAELESSGVEEIAEIEGPRWDHSMLDGSPGKLLIGQSVRDTGQEAVIRPNPDTQAS